VTSLITACCLGCHLLRIPGGCCVKADCHWQEERSSSLLTNESSDVPAEHMTAAAAEPQLGLVPADAAETLLVTGRSLAADEEMAMFIRNLEEQVGHLERALAEEQENRQQREAAIHGWVDQVQFELIGAGKRAKGIQQQISKVQSCLRQDER